MSQNSEENKSSTTALLLAWQQGDSNAGDALSTLVHAELDRLARGYMYGERAAHTLQATALVNEAWLQLVDANVAIESREHFCALAARMMRRILVDHARARGRDKRGGGAQAITLNESLVGDGNGTLGLLEIDEALTRLAEHDPKLCEAVELVYFGGLSYEEAARVLGMSRSSFGAELKFARAWLQRAMQG